MFLPQKIFANVKLVNERNESNHHGILAKASDMI